MYLLLINFASLNPLFINEYYNITSTANAISNRLTDIMNSVALFYVILHIALFQSKTTFHCVCILKIVLKNSIVMCFINRIITER